MQYPDDLPGGWSCFGQFVHQRLAVGQVWRKPGPLHAIKIVRIEFPGRENYDGGLPGIAARRTIIRRGRVVWSETRFYPSENESSFLRFLQDNGYFNVAC